MKLAWNRHGLLFHLPTGKLKALMNFYQQFVLYIHFSLLNSLNRQNVKKFYN